MSHFDLVRSYRAQRIESGSDALPQEHTWVARCAAFAIDVVTFLIAAPFVLGLCAVFLREYWAVGGVTVIALYTTGAWLSCGQTLGMSLVGIRLVDERQRRCPSLAQAVMRSALTLPPLVGATILLNAILVPESSSLPGVVIILATAATLVGILSGAWALVDGGRMLHDRLCGLLIVRESTTALRRPVAR